MEGKLHEEEVRSQRSDTNAERHSVSGKASHTGPSPLQIQLQMANNYIAHMDRLAHEKRRIHLINMEWRDIAHICDRVFFILYCFITITTTLALLLQCIVK